MKTYYNETRTKRIWWDRYQKHWVMQNMDKEGNPIDGADYTCNKIYAFNWLNEWVNAQNYYKQLLISAYIQLNNARANKTYMEMIGTDIDIRDASDYVYDAQQIVKFIELNDPDKFHDNATCDPL